MKLQFFSRRQDISIRTLLITGGFGFLFSLCCVCGWRLDQIGVCFGGGASSAFVTLGLAIVGTIPAAVFFMLLLMGIESLEKTETPSEEKAGNLRFAISALVVLLLGQIPIFLAYYPSVFTYDAEGQMYQVIAYDFSTHHPLLHTLFMGMFLKLGERIGSMNTAMAYHSVVQMLLVDVILVYTLLYLKKRGVNPIARWAILLFYAFFPMNSILILSTTKDVLFAAFSLWLLICVDRVFVKEYDPETGLLKKGAYTALEIAPICCMLMRNNALHALIPTMLVLWLILRIKTEKRTKEKTLITLLCSIVLFLLISGGMKTMLHASAGSPREMLSIPIQQIARTRVLHYEEMSSEDKAQIDQVIDPEWYDRYNEHLADPIKERLRFDEPAKFVKCWAHFLGRYPGDYIDAFLLTTEGLWYPEDRSAARIYGEGVGTGFGLLSTDMRRMPAGYEVTRDSKLPWLFDLCERLVTGNSFERVPVIRLLFKPGFYFWTYMIWLMYCIYQRKWSKIGAGVFAGMYALTLLLSPAILMRYCFFLVLGVPVLWALVKGGSD